MVKSRRLVALIKKLPRRLLRLTSNQTSTPSAGWQTGKRELAQGVGAGGLSSPFAAARRREVAETAGREQCNRHAAEHEERIGTDEMPVVSTSGAASVPGSAGARQAEWWSAERFHRRRESDRRRPDRARREAACSAREMISSAFA